IEPRFLEWLPEAEGHITTPRGKIRVAYRQGLTALRISVEIPHSLQAELCVKGRTMELKEGKNEFRI
ncbi:MAG: hypothetical protein II697_03885, partial [Clostridia bacterium]|nr:hypothetical protein [Clostridia bacterium]